MTHIEAMKQALEALESSRVFVTTKEKIKHPEGTEWYDNALTSLRQALANEALDRMAENARELGLDYEPADGTQVSKVWWDGEKLMAKPIPLSEFYKEPEQQPADEPVAWQAMIEDEAMKEFAIKDMAHDWCIQQQLRGSPHKYWLRPLYARPQEFVCSTGLCHYKAQPKAEQEPVAWNGEKLTWKLVPIKPTQAMLNEMNLTGREGYDEIMGDGFSASLYHAALIASPPQPKAEQFTYVGWRVVDDSGIPVPVYTFKE